MELTAEQAERGIAYREARERVRTLINAAGYGDERRFLRRDLWSLREAEATTKPGPEQATLPLE